MITDCSNDVLLYRLFPSPRKAHIACLLGLAIVLFAVLLSAGGCGPSGPPPRTMVPISGTVTLDGKPLPDGIESFVSPQEGRFETFPVKEGKFTGKAELGVRTVEIIAIRDVQAPASGNDGKGPPKPARENYLPSKYSMNSPLRADVTEAGPNTFTFELTMGK